VGSFGTHDNSLVKRIINEVVTYRTRTGYSKADAQQRILRELHPERSDGSSFMPARSFRRKCVLPQDARGGKGDAQQRILLVTDRSSWMNEDMPQFIKIAL
jgi:hypothetical protein